MSPKPLTNTYVQETLGNAVTVLTEDGGEDKVLIAGLLDKLKSSYASGNSIPVGRGLGLEQAVKLAEHYIAESK